MFDRLRAAGRAPARAGSVAVGYVGVILALAFTASTGHSNDNQIRAEAHQREADICSVISNAHESAKVDAERAAYAVQSTREYLKDPRSRESAALYHRVKANLPNTIKARDAARQRERSLVPPPTCKPYLPKKEKS